MEITILTETELRQCVALEKAAIDTVEQAFTWLAEGRVTLPPILRLDIHEHHGEVDVKTAYVRGRDRFAIKIASGFFANVERGLPSGSGLMVLISAETGIPAAVLLDNGYLTDLRTAAAGAVAARHMARQEFKTAGVIGAGTQARYQMMALKQVRDFSRLLVYSRTPERTSAYAAGIAPLLGVEAIVADSPEEVVRGSDVVVTTTPAREPYLRPDWLHPGLHITAMGSDAEEKQELYPQVLAQADLIVCDSRDQCARLGELHHALEAGVLSSEQWDAIAELGQVTSGERAGREDEEQITLCDLTGVGVQDTAIALLAHHRAEELGFGLQVKA